jgi:hypothetical protein
MRKLVVAGFSTLEGPCVRNFAGLVCAFLLFTATALAAPREWKEMRLINIASASANSGGAVVPVGTVLYGVPIVVNTTYYVLKGDDLTYVIAYTFNPMLQWRNKPPILTLNGTAKTSVDGRNMRVRDDTGKEYKLPIVQKVAAPAR